MKPLAFLLILACVPAYAGETIYFNRTAKPVEPVVIHEQDLRVEVRVYSTDWCPACRVWEGEKDKFPWVKWVKVSDHPDWVPSYPTFHWQATDGSWKQSQGWNAETFRSMLRQTVWDTNESALPGLALPAEASPTPLVDVRSGLEILRPVPSETFVDYGCGADARWCIAAAKFYGCKAVGIEIDPVRAEQARQAVREQGLEDQVKIFQADATKLEIKADVGVAYLYPEVLKQLEPKVQKLDRFLSYLHSFPGSSRQGDFYVWNKPRTQSQVQRSQPVAYWNGQAYYGRQCSSSNCRMCNSIQRQLGY